MTIYIDVMEDFGGVKASSMTTAHKVTTEQKLFGISKEDFNVPSN